MEIFIPAKIVEGVTLKNGTRLKYPMNGLAAFLLSHAVPYAMCWLGLLDPYFIWSNMGALLTVGANRENLGAWVGEPL